MKRTTTVLAAALFAVALTLPGAASAGPPGGRSAGLLQVLLAIGAAKARPQALRCGARRCSAPTRRLGVRDGTRQPATSQASATLLAAR